LRLISLSANSLTIFFGHLLALAADVAVFVRLLLD